jgi:hypothetical protein
LQALGDPCSAVGQGLELVGDVEITAPPPVKAAIGVKATAFAAPE